MMTEAELNLVTHPPPRRASARLTPEQLGKIRTLASQGLQTKQLAERFGLDKATVSNIVQKRRGYAE